MSEHGATDDNDMTVYDCPCGRYRMSEVAFLMIAADLGCPVCGRSFMSFHKRKIPRAQVGKTLPGEAQP